MGRKLSLTTAGTLLASSAEAILREAEHVEGTLIGADDIEQTEIIRIGSYAYSCYRWLPKFLKQLRPEMPQVLFEFDVETATIPLKSVSNGTVDIGIAAGVISSKAIEVTPLFDDELVAICHSEHALAGRDYLEAADFLKDPFITYSTNVEVGFEEDLLWRPAGCRPRKFLRAGLTEAVIELVRAEFGLSILSRWAVAPYLKEGDLACIRITEKGLPLRWSALSRRSHQNAKTISVITERLEQWCRQNF